MAYKLNSKGYKCTIVYQYFNPNIGLAHFPFHETINHIYPNELVNTLTFDWVISTFWTTVYHLHHVNATYYSYFNQCDERLFYSKKEWETFWVHTTYRIPNFPIITPSFALQKAHSAEGHAKCYTALIGINETHFNEMAVPISKRGSKLRVLIEGAGKAKFKRVREAFEITGKFENDIEVWYVSYDGYHESTWKADRVFSKVDNYNMPAIYASCDVLLKLSDVESFGLPNVEMMACGGTFITTNFTGHDEYAVNGVNGYVIDRGNFVEAENRLKDLINSPQKLAELKLNAIQSAQKWTLELFSKNFINVLKDITIEFPNGNQKYVLSELCFLSDFYHQFQAEQYDQKKLKRLESNMHRSLTGKLFRKFGNK